MELQIGAKIAAHAGSFRYNYSYTANECVALPSAKGKNIRLSIPLKEMR